MAANMYTVEKTIRGKKYTAQFSGISTALRAVDSSYIDGTSNTSIEKLAEFMFEYIIVEPKGLTIDEFESMAEFNEVIAFAREVMQGDFRKKENEKSAKKASKE